MSAARPPPQSFPVQVVLTALVAFGPISTDLYLASLPDMARAFATDPGTVQLTLSAFLIGIGVGMPVYGPLSDRFGRRRVIIGGVLIYLVASVFCMLAPSIEALIVGRFLQALGAGVGPVVGRAVVRDVYPRDQAAKVLSYMASAMALAPFGAPIVGGWFHALFGWRSNFALLVAFGLGLLVGVWRLLDETNRQRDPLALHPARMAANYTALLREPTVRACVLTVALGFGGMFAFISASSFLLIDVLALAPAHFGFGFAVVILGYILGGLLAGKLTARVGLERMVRLGTVGLFAAGAVQAGLAWAGIQTLPALLLPMSAYFFFAALVLPNATAAAIAPFPGMAGAASALVGLLQMIGGAGAGWLVGHLFDGSTRPLGTVLLILGAGAWLAFRGVRPAE
ncbi:MAG: multidrug effflux MFS transporter [Magnetospirillum sp.]|nr:multidrug effflux MFS transporter [Magnetospirillum sp.]